MGCAREEFVSPCNDMGGQDVGKEEMADFIAPPHEEPLLLGGVLFVTRAPLGDKAVDQLGDVVALGLGRAEMAAVADGRLDVLNPFLGERLGAEGGALRFAAFDAHFGMEAHFPVTFHHFSNRTHMTPTLKE